MWLLLPFLALPAAFFFHVWLRKKRKTNPQALQRETLLVSVTIGFAFALVNGAIAAAWAPEEIAAAWLYCEILSLCVAYCYFHLVNMAHTARRIHLLLNLSSEKLEYDTHTMVQKRLERMQEMKIIFLENEKFRMRKNILYYVAAGFAVWRKILFR